MGSRLNGGLVVAHELRQPVSTMRQLAFCIQMSNSAMERQELAQKIIDLSNSTLRQINLLAETMDKCGNLTMEPVAVRQICNEVSSDIKTALTGQEYHLKISYKNRARLVMANPILLKNILENFCINAVKFSESETESMLTVTEHNFSSIVRLSVRDYGPAIPVNVWRELASGELKIPPEVMMRPSDSFLSGSGIGLYTASRFAKLMRGRIGAIRHRDGASFFIELPTLKQQELF